MWSKEEIDILMSNIDQYLKVNFYLNCVQLHGHDLSYCTAVFLVTSISWVMHEVYSHSVSCLFTLRMLLTAYACSAPLHPVPVSILCVQSRGIHDPSEIIFEMSKDERKDFYRSIAWGLNRPLFAVYRRVLRMYDNRNHVGK